MGWAHNSAVECVLHTDEVAGSSPAAPTRNRVILVLGLVTAPRLLMDPNATSKSHDRGPSPSRRRRLLLADDDDDIRGVFELVLSEHFDVECAKSAAEALSCARAQPPNVILVDWTLPDMSGGELVTQLRASTPELAEVPVVIVSGSPSVKALAEGIGAVPCSKPCDVDQLLAAIERAMAARSS